MKPVLVTKINTSAQPKLIINVIHANMNAKKKIWLKMVNFNNNFSNITTVAAVYFLRTGRVVSNWASHRDLIVSTTFLTHTALCMISDHLLSSSPLMLTSFNWNREDKNYYQFYCRRHFRNASTSHLLEESERHVCTLISIENLGK